MTKTMWLARNGAHTSNDTYLWYEPPVWDDFYRRWYAIESGRHPYIQFDPAEISLVFPSLKIKKGQCIKVKVTNSPNGVSIRRAK
jgi:hypothetical protein